MSRKQKESKEAAKRSGLITSLATTTSNENNTSDRSIKVPQRDKIDWDLNIRMRDDLTEKQKGIIDLILDKNTKVVFLSGPAGTSKSFVAVLAGLMMLNKRCVSDITYVRTVIESASKGLGALPGEAGEKLEPYMRPLRDKLDEMLPAGDVKKLVCDERVIGIPVNYLRGASFNARYLIFDEGQNGTVKEITTFITRIGMYSKMIICGDPSQSDINGASGFLKFYDLFNDEASRAQGIHCISFTKDDIVRSGVLRYIAERIENSGSLLR